jgi:hypothetical protein
MTASNPHAARDRLAETALQVGSMARALSQPDPPVFMVLLFTYLVEGQEYSTTGLTVSATATPNLVVTRAGFECDAFFAPELLESHVREGKDLVDGSIRVRLAVRLRDIIQIAPLTNAR